MAVLGLRSLVPRGRVQHDKYCQWRVGVVNVNEAQTNAWCKNGVPGPVDKILTSMTFS